MSQDIPIPQSLLQRQREVEKMLQDLEESKRLKERYVALKRRLETCREVKNTSSENLKDRRAVSYFETCQGQIQGKLDQHDVSLKKILDQMENARKNLEDKLAFVNQRLELARERADNQTRHKTKEEITIEREIQDMIPKYSELQPNTDLNQAFPDFRNLLHLPEPTPVESPPPFKGKRKAKQVPRESEEEINLPPPPSPPCPPPELAPEPLPSKPSLYGNVVQNSKVQRK
jgi:hypothetical protein